MKIKDVITSAGVTGFYFDDQQAIKKGAKHDGFTYCGESETCGFSGIRQAGESISVMIVLTDGTVAYGDCAAVQYSGAGGRDPLFLAEEFIPLIESEIAPQLVGRELTEFRPLAEEIDQLQVAGEKLHTALRYGITQALLDGVAKAQRKTRTEVIIDEYGLDSKVKPVPIFAQSGDERHLNVDKMIIKGVDVLPHGLINNVEEKLGPKGEKLIEYIQWIKDRIQELKVTDDYHPELHLDVYGTIGLAFEEVEEKVDYLEKLARVASPYKLKVEEPIDEGGRAEEIEAMRKLRQRLKERQVTNLELVADEWCNTLEDIKLFVDQGAPDVVQIKTPDLGGINNTIEAVLYCQEQGVGAYLGGTCNETDRSAQICTDIALATQPDQVLAKPGMGFDEGYMIVKNQMQRTLKLINSV